MKRITIVILGVLAIYCLINVSIYLYGEGILHINYPSAKKDEEYHVKEGTSIISSAPSPPMIT